MFLLDSVTVLGDDLGLESTFTRSRLDMDTLGDGLGPVLEITPGMKGFQKPAHPGAVSSLLWKHFPHIFPFLLFLYLVTHLPGLNMMILTIC